MSQSLRLKLTLPDGNVVEEVFTQDSIIVGSGPSAAMKVDHEEISSMHMIIKVQAEGITVADLGSDTGTKVRDKSITEEVSVSPSDKICLGKIEMEFEILTAEESEDVAHDKDKTENENAEAEANNTEETGTEDGATLHDAEPASAAAADAETHEPVTPDRRTMSGFVDMELDMRLLADELVEENRPTNNEHALEIKAFWGDTILDSALVHEPRDVTVSGSVTHHTRGDLQVEFPVPGLENQIFTVANNAGTTASVVVPKDAKVGLRTADGKVTRSVSMSATDAPFPAQAYSLKFGDRLAYKIGTVTIVAQYVRGDAETGRSAPIDWHFPRIFIISALIHMFFMVAAFVTPHYQTSLTDDLFKNENRFAQMILKAPEKEKKRKKLDLSGSKGGAKHKGDEGKFGKKDKPKKDALASKAGAPRVDPNKREKDRKIAMNSGLLGMLGKGSGAVSNVFGPGGLGTGINNAMGGLRGSAMGDAGGAGGLGTRGAGAGGGGNSLGIGGLGTHGHGRGTGGYGNIDLGGRGKGETRIVPGRTIIRGSLSKEEINRVIRRNLARFKYCYEKQLNANPNLSGKISVYFMISPTGSVGKASIRESSMNDSAVEKCVTKVMKTLKFPQPRGGGVVVVTYPFVFAST